MKVTKELFNLTNEILETYDPGKLKAESIRKIEEEKSKLKTSAGDADKGKGVGSIDKWDKISKQIEVDEKLDEAKNNNNQEQ